MARIDRSGVTDSGSTDTTPAYMRLLPAGVMPTLSRLGFLARGTVEGFITGRHRSPHKGFSVEFAEHRQYVAGDDPRDMDWRVYARNDRYYIKQYAEETNLRATLLVDVSGSMAYTGRSATRVGKIPLSKLDYARYLAASLTYILNRQQDAVGLVTFDTGVRSYVPARSQVSQVGHVLGALDAACPGGETDPATVFHTISERIHRRGVVIILSDLFGDLNAILKAFHHFRACRHEVMVFHIMAAEELSFPFDDFTRFRDLEVDGRILPIDAAALKAQYLDTVRKFVKGLKQGCGSMKIDYAPVITSQPYDVALAESLAQRGGRRKNSTE